MNNSNVTVVTPINEDRGGGMERTSTFYFKCCVLTIFKWEKSKLKTVRHISNLKVADIYSVKILSLIVDQMYRACVRSNSCSFF